jgi:anti-sigma-K factor RskA
MLTCREITELATDFAEGHLADSERLRFETHVADCHGCAAWVRQMQATARAMGALPEPELPGALQAALLARFDAWSRQQVAARSSRAAQPVSGTTRRFTLTPAIAIVAAFGLLVGLARGSSGAPSDWLIAIGLVVVAVTLVALWRRVTLGFAAVAATASLLAAAASGRHGSLDGTGGLDCLLTIGGVAAGAAGAAWVVLRKEPGQILGSAMGAWAAAGALASVAALQVACRAPRSLAHLLTFHVGGLLAVIVAGYLAPRLLARPAPKS